MFHHAPSHSARHRSAHIPLGVGKPADKRTPSQCVPLLSNGRPIGLDVLFNPVQILQHWNCNVTQNVTWSQLLNIFKDREQMGWRIDRPKTDIRDHRYISLSCQNSLNKFAHPRTEWERYCVMIFRKKKTLKVQIVRCKNMSPNCTEHQTHSCGWLNLDDIEKDSMKV